MVPSVAVRSPVPSVGGTGSDPPSAWPGGSLGWVPGPVVLPSSCPSPLLRGRVGGGGGARLQSEQRGVALSICSCFTLAPPEKVVPAPPSAKGLAAPQVL